MNPLLCVITGLEHSGTTLLSQLLNGHPKIAAGVECGILLRDLSDLDKSEPWWGWFLMRGWGWALLPEDREQIRNAGTYDNAYRLLAKLKGRAQQNAALRQIFTTAPQIFDKTPAYVRVLSTVMDKTDRPFVVLFKTPEEAWQSHQKRGANISQFCSLYAKSAIGLADAISRHDDRLLVVSYRSLAESTAATMARVARHIDLEPPYDLTMERYEARMGSVLRDFYGRKDGAVRFPNTFRPVTPRYTPPSPGQSNEERAILALGLAEVTDELDLIGRHLI